MNNKVSVLFVCMGNICRSPTAEAVFRHYVGNAGLTGYILIDSAGTHDYHIGDAPDARAQRAAQQRGYDMSGLRGRQVDEGDFYRFDYVLAMDRTNLSILHCLAPQGRGVHHAGLGDGQREGGDAGAESGSGEGQDRGVGEGDGGEAGDAVLRDV